MNKEAIIIFIKNPVAGKVKTRLARHVGDLAALTVYTKLVKHTAQIVSDCHCEKLLYYSDFIPETESAFPEDCGRFLQKGDDLGERMARAFQATFQSGYERVVIIGTDCMQLNSGHLLSSFSALKENDVVIGPAKDGGYYLLGLTKFYPELFQEKTWSSPLVFKQTTASVKDLNLKHSLLPVLSDVDVYEDLVIQNISF